MGQGSNDFYPVSLVLANRSACALHLAEQQESSFKSDTLHTNVIRFYCSQGLRDVDQALKLGYKTPSKLWLRRAKLLTIQLMTGVQQEDEETILVEEERGESAGACRWDKVHDCFRQALKSAGSNSAAASIQRDWGDIKRKISSHKRCSNLRRILTFSTGGRGRSDSTTQLEITHTPRISQTDYKERSLVASCDLSQGQVVLTDTLFAATPQHYSDNSSSKRANEPVNCSLLYAACDFCQSPLHGFGIPCAKSPCGIGALYCKESCRDDAFSRFHSLECGKPTLNGIPDSSVRLAFRMYYTLSSGDVKRKHVGEKEEENEGMKISSLSSPTSSSNDRESISKLVDHIQELDKKVKERDLLLEHVMVGTLLHSISPTPTRFVKRLATLDDLRKYHDLVMELLSLVLKARCNSFSIKHHSESSSSSPSPSSTSNILPPASVGSGIYLSASLLNHSCNPNCLVFFSKNTIIIRSSRSIKVGEELCISYGPLSPRHLLGDRHMALLKRWHFKCSCKECNSGNPYRQDLSARLYHGWKCPECKGGSTLPFSESSFDPAMCTECYGGGELTAECEIEDRAAYYYDLVSRVMSRDGDATSSSSSSITFEDQVSTLEKCLHFRQQVLSSPNGKLGATHDLLGRLYASRGHFQLAASHVRKSLSSVIFSFGKWSIEASGEYAKLAGLLVQCEEFDEAKAVAKDGIECFKRVYGITGDYTTDNDEDVNEDIEELYQILEI